MVPVVVKDPPEPPVPSPGEVTASRRHLTERYASGVDRLLWDQEEREMPDAEAIRALLSAASAGKSPDALDIGAALVTLQAVRLETDLLEADVLDAAKTSGVAAESLAAVLGLPDADVVDARHRELAAKRALPRALTWKITLKPRPPTAAREAAERAGKRARQAADRAAAVGRRREELRDAHGTPAERDVVRAHADEESGYVDEARASARDAAERVALGLLRAAEALDRCAARCGEWEKMTAPGISRAQLRRRASEYARAARDYREMAGRYRGGSPGR